MFRLTSLLRSAALLVGVAISTIPAAMTMGVNLSGGGGGTQLAFKDQVWGCRDWRAFSASKNWDYPHGHLGLQGADPNTIKWRSDGYPEEIPYNGLKVVMLFLVNLPAKAYPYGTFTLTFEGKGEIWLGWDAGGPAPAGYTADGTIPPGHGHTVTGNGGQTTFTFDIKSKEDFFGYYHWFNDGPQSTGINLHINRSDKADPIRNIHLIIPDQNGGTSYVDNYEAQPFNPAFLEEIRIFEYYRFMDWGHTNNNPLERWANRTKTDVCFGARDVFKTGGGLPYEFWIQLCNLTKRDMWLCLPHRAYNDEFLTNLASLVYNNLDKDLKVYLEYSNEVWNPLFDQQGQVAHFGAVDPGIGGSRDKFHVYAAVKLFEAFEAKFGKDSPRLYKTLNGWTINTDLTKSLLGALKDNTVNPNGVKVNGFGLAPYIGAGGTRTIEDVRSHMAGRLNYVAEQKSTLDGISMGYPVELITYEAGQSVWQNGIADQLNRDQGFYDVYKDYLAGLQSRGVKKFSQFSSITRYSADYAWGYKEYLGQPAADAPKYRALYEYITNNNIFDPSEPKPWESASTIAGPWPGAVMPGGTPSQARRMRAVYGIDGRLMGRVAPRTSVPVIEVAPEAASMQPGVRK